MSIRIFPATARRRPAVLAALAALICAGATACASGATPAPGASPSSAASVPAAAAVPAAASALQQAYVSVISRVLPSVVEIRSQDGLGSGVVFDAAGDIVTNAHVVGNATSFQVFLAGSVTPRSASLVGSYPPDDLAVVKLTRPAHLTPARFADSRTLRVGQIVLAMGNPLGLASSATDGIISAVGRTVSEPTEGTSPGATLPDAIQTSAPINPGNSGGALVDLSGRVVGIPTLAATDPQLGGAAVGIGFAIPSDIVTSIAGQLVKTGHVTNSHRAALGVSVQTVTGPDGQPAGVGVAAVTRGGPAAKAGLRAGDVITAIGNQATPDTESLAAVLAGLRPGQRVQVSVLRPSGGKAVVEVTLGLLPGS